MKEDDWIGWELPPGTNRPRYCLMPKGEKCGFVILRMVDLPQGDNPTGSGRAPTRFREFYCDCDYAPDVRPEDEDPTEDPSREYFYGSFLGWVSEFEHERIQEDEKERQRVAKLSTEEREKERLEREKEYMEIQKEWERREKEHPDDPFI